jgi:hypothetical protein
MSHRVTFRSSMTDSELIKKALEETKHKFTMSGDVITITSGVLDRATINAKTGEIVSDSDYHRPEQLGALRQAYSEAQFRKSAFIKGVTIHGRDIVEHDGVKGVVRLKCSANTL